MMFTLEPGLYFPEEGIGIRIEDTLLVTEDGCEVLTADIPKTVEEIEALCNRKGKDSCVYYRYIVRRKHNEPGNPVDHGGGRGARWY